MALAGLAGLAFVLVAGLVIWPTPKPVRKQSTLQGCVRYFLVPVEWICGKKVIWVNPDGSHVLLGNAGQLRMPRPRPVKQ